MRVLICGSRNARAIDSKLIDRTLRALAKEFPGFRACHGNAPGTDRYAGWVCKHVLGLDVKSFPANWKGLGNAAGPVRNQQMLNEFKPELVVAFPGGTGTADMVAKARAAGVTVREIAPREGVALSGSGLPLREAHQEKEQ